MAGKCPAVSVVAPLLDEQDNIQTLYEQISAALAGKYEYEMVLVDDGSTDKSFEISRTAEAKSSSPSMRTCRTTRPTYRR